METLVKKRKYTYAEYLQLELDTDVRHEFWNGEVFAMAGTSKGHNDIVANINGFLRNHFKPLGCSVHSESVKLELEKENYYVYPDLLLSCDDADKTDAYLIKNPSLIVEVLSPSTESYDRREKTEKPTGNTSATLFSGIVPVLPFCHKTRLKAKVPPQSGTDF